MFVAAVSQQPGPDAVWSSLVRLQSLGLEFLLLNNHGADFQHFLVELSTNPREVSQCPISYILGAFSVHCETSRRFVDDSASRTH